MRTAHIPCGLGGSLWTGAILGWHPVYALDYQQWRIDRIIEQQESGIWPAFPYDCADLGAWEPPELDAPLDLLAAGFSCQDISIAGKGAGISGRSSGPTYRGCLAAIDAWRPTWIFFENSPEIRTRGRDRVTGDLVARGYRWRDGIIGAADVGAPHQRDRWFLLAVRADIAEERRHEDAEMAGSSEDQAKLQLLVQGVSADTDCEPLRQRTQGFGALPNEERHDSEPEQGRIDQRCWYRNGSTDAADTLRDGLQKSIQQGWVREAGGKTVEAAAGYCGAHHWNPPDASLCGMVDGVAYPRGFANKHIAGLGDAWVPLQAAAAWCLLGGPIGCIAT